MNADTAAPLRLRRDHFALLYAGMLVAAAGNTALQSVMPAIGRQMGMNDVWVAIAYTWSAVLWVISNWSLPPRASASPAASSINKVVSPSVTFSPSRVEGS